MLVPDFPTFKVFYNTLKNIINIFYNKEKSGMSGNIEEHICLNYFKMQNFTR